ncbi:MAG: hypothetical protein K2M89_06410 [Clostridiales bacterium]|nr:hypothetical protein [Clostridiales bacterium]
MQRFYDDITVHGTVRADKLSGELSESTRKPIDDQIAAARDKLETTQSALAGAQETIDALVANYNNAIKVINNLSERMAALESNYDPTVIGEPPAIKKQGE